MVRMIGEVFICRGKRLKVVKREFGESRYIVCRDCYFWKNSLPCHLYIEECGSCSRENSRDYPVSFVELKPAELIDKKEIDI